jgi:16S rRNA (cytidine1402-2'-O)-methyltransferase
VNRTVSRGELFVVGTPIGNLADLGPRARETLEAATVCFAEDTRRTGRLLAHFGLDTPLRSLHAHNEASRIGEVLERLEAGESVALVSDSGTPTVSDPGRRLVAAVLATDAKVTPVPGPSAVPAALSVSGLPADRFLFAGFPPRKSAAREAWLESVASSPVTVVAFEAPGRLTATLRDLSAAGAGGRDAVVCRELTKLHEEVRRAAIDDLATVYEGRAVKGEVTIVLAGADAAGDGEDVDSAAVAAEIERMVNAGESRREIADRLKERFGLTRNEAYRLSLTAGGTDGDD